MTFRSPKLNRILKQVLRSNIQSNSERNGKAACDDDDIVFSSTMEMKVSSIHLAWTSNNPLPRSLSEMVYFSPEDTSIQKLLQNDIATWIDDRMRVGYYDRTTTHTHTNKYTYTLFLVCFVKNHLETGRVGIGSLNCMRSFHREQVRV